MALALGFDEAELDLLGFVVGFVQTEHGAVWGAEVAHTTKLPEYLPGKQWRARTADCARLHAHERGWSSVGRSGGEPEDARE
jgi:hypothetical protein